MLAPYSDASSAHWFYIIFLGRQALSKYQDLHATHDKTHVVGLENRKGLAGG